MGLLNLLGLAGKKEFIKEFMDKGAIIIDVRTKEEFNNGHIKNSKNIPLNTIADKILEIKKTGKPVIVCCQSGMRSGQASSILQKNGIECINGGGWKSLESSL
jgi:phage shock protein E